MGGGSRASGEAGPSAVDHNIGTIVWVRRRNGSWWPGRILGSNELSVSHLMSPRSGTPVKLLGREDASVDWYNLEKSKRVKAFRCGEFDDCIIKAESCAGVPTKKREKYARREDAILHALELEKQQLEQRKQLSCLEAVRSDEKKYGTLVKQSQDFVVDCHNDESQYSPSDGNCNEFLDSKLHMDAWKAGVTGKRTSTEVSTTQLSIQKIREGNEVNWEDDVTEGTPRMRGLQDFGLKIAQKKKKPSITTLSEGIGKEAPADNCACSASCVAGAIENGNPMNNNKGPSLNLKRKRSNVGHGEESSIRRRDRRRPLTQVLQSSAKLPVPALSDFGCNGGDSVQQEVKPRGVSALQPKQVKHPNFSMLLDNNSNYIGASSKRQISLQASQPVSESKEKPFQPFSFTDDNTCSSLLEQPNSNSSEKSGPCSINQVDGTAFTDSFQVLPVSVRKNFPSEVDGRHPEHPIQGHMSLVNKNGVEEADVSSYLSRPESAEQKTVAVADAGVSKWQLKGKRNVRHVSKKNFDNTNERSLVEADNTTMYVKSCEEKLNINEEVKTKKVFGNAPVEHETSPKIERQLDYCFVPEYHVRDDSAKNNTTAFADERQQRTGSTVSRKKAEVQNLSNQERFEDQPRGKISVYFSNENSHTLPPAWEISKYKCLSSDELPQNQRPGQIDSMQILWKKNGEGNSGTFPRLMHEGPKSLDQIHFKQPDSLRGPKVLQSSGRTSVEARLFEVQIDVKASYQGEHVPLVSLMSRLNGKAIVGHPITVETVEDGSDDIFLEEDGYLDDSVINFQSYDADRVEGEALQPVWRTARRTAMQRTPRPCSLLENESNSSQYLTYGNKQPLVKTVYPGLINHKIRYIRKNLSQLRHPTSDKKLSKKFLRKAGLPSQKTRTLSSIAVERKLTSETNESAHPLKMAEVPVVSCVPVKLIFSRLKEAVSSASKSGSHGVSSTSLVVEKPK